MLVGLVFLSIPYVRHRVYEAFCYIHILMAMTYLALLFWHADNLLDSWAYLWAALDLWLASWLARIFHYTRPMNVQNEWLSVAPATIQALPGDMTRIELLAPFNFRYTPAQHCFLRFPFYRLWTIILSQLSLLQRLRNRSSLTRRHPVVG